MPSCTVMTMESRRSMSSLVFKAMPLAVFCNHHTKAPSFSGPRCSP